MDTMKTAILEKRAAIMAEVDRTLESFGYQVPPDQNTEGMHLLAEDDQYEARLSHACLLEADITNHPRSWSTPCGADPCNLVGGNWGLGEHCSDMSKCISSRDQTQRYAAPENDTALGRALLLNSPGAVFERLIDSMCQEHLRQHETEYHQGVLG